MTSTDERLFSGQLVETFKDIYFIDAERSKCSDIKILTDLSEASVCSAILNDTIFSLKDYKEMVEAQNTQTYGFPTVGKGLIQYVPSRVARYALKCLKEGLLCASYFTDDKETEQFVRQVFNIVGKNGKKVFLTSTTRDITSDIAEKNVVAWPDAAHEFNGKTGNYLTQTHARMLIVRD